MILASLDDTDVPPAKKRKSRTPASLKQDEEGCAKAELWESLANSLKSTNPRNNATTTAQGSLEQRADLFGKMVVDYLLQ